MGNREMKTLDRYIIRTLITSIFVVMCILVAVFSFFEFIDELEQVGEGRYGIAQIMQYVLLRIPGLMYQLFPMAALIGTLWGLGTLVASSEIIVMRSVGFPLRRIVLAALQAALAILVVAVAIGELVAPSTERLAREFRSVTRADQITLKTKYGVWVRDGQSYINIRKILPGERIEEIYIYEFDRQNNLKVSTYAEAAEYQGEKWLLSGIDQTFIEHDQVKKRRIKRAEWGSLLKPSLINMVVIEPNSLAIRDLRNYIGYLQRNGQNSQRYEQALWVKMVYPAASVVMVFLGIPIVLRALKGLNIGQRILTGSLVGLGFHIANQAAGHLSIVYNWEPSLSVAFPTLATLFVAGMMMRHVH